MPILPSDSQQRQRVLLGAMLVGGLAYFGYTYGYQPRAAEVDALRTHLETIQLQNRTARALADGGAEEVERQLAVGREQLLAMEALIPSSEELPDLLDAISAEAQRAGVELSLIQPVDVTEEQFYTRRVYDMAVIGRYHGVGEFLARIASLPRIVTPMNLSLASQSEAASGDEPRLQATFSIETYVIPPSTPTLDLARAP